jgi:hypothetical protein
VLDAGVVVSSVVAVASADSVAAAELVELVELVDEDDGVLGVSVTKADGVVLLLLLEVDDEAAARMLNCGLETSWPPVPSHFAPAGMKRRLKAGEDLTSEASKVVTLQR